MLNAEIQKVVDQLVYNELYAPDYPAEDRTTLDKEQKQILLWIDYAITITRREDVGDWLRLGRSSVVDAFAKIKDGDQNDGVRDLQFAVQYLRNAINKKPYRIDMIGMPGGEIIVIPPEADDNRL